MTIYSQSRESVDARHNPITMTFVTDPEEIARANASRAQFDRNSAWLQARVPEIYNQHRGKCVCVAGEELFVADTPEEVMAKANAAHPDDDGVLFRYIPLRKTARIYHASHFPFANLRIASNSPFRTGCTESREPRRRSSILASALTPRSVSSGKGAAKISSS